MESVLIIDDEQSILQVFDYALSRCGFDVETAADGREGLQKFLSGRFDLVVTDMTMPGITGDKLAMALCSIRKDIPVILCTGFSPQMTEKKAYEMGIKGFLMKPIVKYEMARMIRKILDHPKRAG